MIKVLTVCNDPNNQGLKDLVYSLEKFGWEYSIILADWRGFGTKIIETYNYLKNNPEVTEFVFVDAYDVIALTSPDEFFLDAIIDLELLLSAEKNIWPDINLIGEYPTTHSDWKYVNSGLYYCKSEKFIRMVEENPIEYHDDDQRYMTRIYLNERYVPALDTNCMFFQSYSFVSDDDYIIDNGRLFNAKNGTAPYFAHFNGKTEHNNLLEILYNK